MARRRILALVQVQAHQKVKPYQQLRYGSNVPFRHGPGDAVKYSATPLPENPAQLSAEAADAISFDVTGKCGAQQYADREHQSSPTARRSSWQEGSPAPGRDRYLTKLAIFARAVF
jgi:hypothetical protein